MWISKRVVPVVILSLSAAACYSGVEGDLVDEITETRGEHFNTLKWNDLRWNDLKWNDLKWNDLKWNGLRWNDLKWNGLKWNGVVYNDLKWNTSELEGSSIVVKRKVNGKWQKKGGTELIGMEIQIQADVTDEQGQVSAADFVIRADDIYVSDVYDDIHYYDLSISKKGSGVWEPLCGDAAPAIPIRNYWNETTGQRIDDPDVITFACTTGVLAHCVEWGYRPWATSQECVEYKIGKTTKKFCWDVSLKDYHQACTRMARADYCGTGQSWTVPGTPIDIYDALDPRLETPETDWPVEAEWNPNGAYCLNDIRQQGWKAEGKYPQCKWPLAKEKSDCGNLTNHRAMLGSKFEPVE
jgi:hypothetical protein